MLLLRLVLIFNFSLIFFGFLEFFPNWVFDFVGFLLLYWIVKFIGLFFVDFGDYD